MQTITERFRAAIQNFMRSPEYASLNRKLRARVFIEDVEPETSRLILLDMTERAFRMEERRQVREGERAEEDPQMKLLGPGFAELFVSVRERLPLRGGKKAVMDRMTPAQFRESASVIRSRGKKRAAEIVKKDERRAVYLTELAHAMSPYERTHRGLTFREYRQLVSTGVPAKERTRTAGEV